MDPINRGFPKLEDTGYCNSRLWQIFEKWELCMRIKIGQRFDQDLTKI